MEWNHEQDPNLCTGEVANNPKIPMFLLKAVINVKLTLSGTKLAKLATLLLFTI